MIKNSEIIKLSKFYSIQDFLKQNFILLPFQQPWKSQTVFHILQRLGCSKSPLMEVNIKTLLKKHWLNRLSKSKRNKRIKQARRKYAKIIGEFLLNGFERNDRNLISGYNS